MAALACVPRLMSRQITIRSLSGPKERARATLFVTDIINPYLSQHERLEYAVVYGLQSTRKWHRLSGYDANPILLPGERRIGRASAPIFAAYRDGDLVGAVICSCVDRVLPLRLMLHAVRPDFRGLGIGGALVRHLVASFPLAGVVVNSGELDTKRYFTHCGFQHWYKTVSMGDWIGFSQPVDTPEGFWYAAPAADPGEILKQRKRFAEFL